MKRLHNLIANNETWLMQRILDYAKEYDYVQYTSTLLEAWRVSIAGLSQPLLDALQTSDKVRELGPDIDFTQDPIASFGILEAQLHRARGISFSMFLGLMKYYRQSYLDLIHQAGFEQAYEGYCRRFVDRFFDRIEIGFSVEWLESSEEEKLKELQATNRNMTNEKNKYLTIFESLPNPVILHNDDNQIENLNFAAAEMFAGKQIPGAIYYGSEAPENSLNWLQEELASFLLTNNSEISFEKKFKNNQKTGYFNVKFARMLDSSEKYRGTIVILKDVTERKKIEKQMAIKKQQLVRSNAELQQFAYVASHDLQEPLRMIASYVQLLARRYKGKLDSDADEFIDFAVDGSKRMQMLINDLLTYSRLGTRSKPYELVNCNDLLINIIAHLKLSIEESGAIITHDPLPNILADRLQLEQLFQNLLSNAIKFHGNDLPRIHVNVTNSDVEWIFSVSDNGIGIDPEFFERIFVIFQRLHGKAEYPGTGIGLAICKKIVEHYGGRIWVASQPGKGTTFYFTIPLIGGNNT